MHGFRVGVSTIKATAGGTIRGLTLRQLRDVMRAVGLGAEAVKFDPSRAESYPTPGVVLLNSGHYVVVRSRRRSKLEIYDPALGWTVEDAGALAGKTNGLGVLLGDVDRTRAASLVTPAKGISAPRLLSSAGAGTIVLTALAQVATLLLPLFSKQAVDGSSIAAATTPVIGLAVGFFLASVIAAGMSFMGNALGQQMAMRLTQATSAQAFDHLAGKPFGWFEAHKASAIHHKLTSLNSQVSWWAELWRATGSTLVIFVVGMIAVFTVSPLLVVPGIISFAVTCGVEFWFTRLQAPLMANFVETAQARQSFILDMLGQIPLLARAGVLPQAKGQFADVIERASASDARIQALRNRQSLVIAFVRSAETLVFLALASSFMLRGAYTLGSFVALAAYKDLLTQSLKTLFQFQQRHELLEVHRLQASDLVGAAPPLHTAETDVLLGTVALSDVWYRYGALDPHVLRGISLTVNAGECLVIKGPSGGGKSTLAKIICGLVAPERGAVLIDGRKPAYPMRGFSAVLQTDRLVSGSIRENIRLFRADISDEQIFEALDGAQLGDFVRGLPMRLNTPVAEGMAGLSGGQRQRLLIARSLVAKPRLILLDEATSSLDIETEARIIESVRTSGATVILIAHRPEVWVRADREIVVAQGAVSADPGRTDAAMPLSREAAL